MYIIPFNPSPSTTPNQCIISLSNELSYKDEVYLGLVPAAWQTPFFQALQPSTIIHKYLVRA